MIQKTITAENFRILTAPYAGGAVVPGKGSAGLYCGGGGAKVNGRGVDDGVVDAVDCDDVGGT